MAKIKLTTRQDQQIDLAVHQLQHYADIVEIHSWAELLECYLSLKQDVYPKKVFLILDDAAQAKYTSMHAVEDDRLYVDFSDDLNGIEVGDPSWEQTYQNVCVPKQLRHYLQQLSDPAHQLRFENFAEKMQHYDESDLEAIIYFNQNLLISMESVIEVKVADVETEALKLAMLPNGYFSCDFDPFENFAIIEKMRHYGFEFIGLGAALLGWIKTSAFKADTIDDLVQDLALIYPLDISHQEKIKALILKNDYLILPYSESPQEYLGYDL
ncbi:hypothetical protein F895_03605 [Acinetobacter sp. CIP 64.2]|uniref:hypothetical protein n=1 Tax=unclassified Acinetobacter TaxID=196816 RepID=UPI000288C276|nr:MULTISPECIES: hypothetical protein [unclassified Acinetobacter]ENX12094.1 hypothetical protein F895_03605 [Acinetobacter sp. CIP 64.2]